MTEQESKHADDNADQIPSCSSPDGHKDNGNGECANCGLIRDVPASTDETAK